jgi:hypothetical protein
LYFSTRWVAVFGSDSLNSQSRGTCELREPLGGERAELVLGHGSARDDERLDLLAEDRVRHADDRDLRDARVLAQRLLDEHRRDVLAARAG